MSTVASTMNETRTMCVRWAGRWAAISVMASAMAPSSPWEEAPYVVWPVCWSMW